ncbi:vacuolar protein sorting-associated protein 45 [Datura stramonium]|uniref:Vacuolar protein sorting-associated protein 45 n=1 Tax=Datura stramonium TaxID=4076 RepID=A0ABS8RLX7_DATST|nr:vacuolar protein sorting-associated protein 45 [Datura stramonium]
MEIAAESRHCRLNSYSSFIMIAMSLCDHGTDGINPLRSLCPSRNRIERLTKGNSAPLLYSIHGDPGAVATQEAIASWLWLPSLRLQRRKQHQKYLQLYIQFKKSDEVVYDDATSTNVHPPLPLRSVLCRCMLCSSSTQGKRKASGMCSLGVNISSGRPQEVVIFIVGGTTYEESRSVALQNSTNSGIRFILGGSALLNSKRFLKDLEEAQRIARISTNSKGGYLVSAEVHKELSLLMKESHKYIV